MIGHVQAALPWFNSEPVMCAASRAHHVLYHVRWSIWETLRRFNNANPVAISPQIVSVQFNQFKSQEAGNLILESLQSRCTVQLYNFMNDIRALIVITCPHVNITRISCRRKETTRDVLLWTQFIAVGTCIKLLTSQKNAWISSVTDVCWANVVR